MCRDILFIFFLSACIFILEAAAEIVAETPNQAVARQDIAEVEAKADEYSRQWNGDSLRRSIVLYRDASNRWLQINDKNKAADCLLKIARLFLLLGEVKENVESLKQALELNKQENNTAGELKTYSLLASASLRLEDSKQIAYYSKQAAALRQSTTDATAQSAYFSALAEIKYQEKKFDDSIADYEKSLNLLRQTGDLRGEAEMLLAVAYVYMSKGDPSSALRHVGESLKKYEQTGDQRGKVLARIAVGVMNSKLGNKQTALEAFQQAERLFPDDVDYLERGDMYNRIAEIHASYEDLPLALDYHLRAFDLFNKEQNPYAQLATLPSLGKLTYKSGEENRGLQYFEQGFRLADTLQDDYFHSILLEELGNLYFERDKNKSLQYFKQALSHFEKTRFRNRIALIQDNLGMIYESRQQFSEARKYYRSSLKISREIKNRFAEAEAVYHLAKLDALEGNTASALETAEQSISVTESLYSDVVNARLKRNYFSNVFDRYELYINLLMKMNRRTTANEFHIRALQAAEKSRSRSILESLALTEADLKKDADPEVSAREKEIRNFLNVKADLMTDLLSRGADQNELNKLSDEIAVLENQLELIKAELKQKSPLYAEIKNPPPFDVAAFQERVLDENSLLLEFSLGNEESYLWLIGKREFFVYVLPGRVQIESRLQRLRELLSAREPLPDESIESYQTRNVEAEEEYERESQILSDMLFGQIADRISNKRLIIVPDGKLYYFPVSALPFPRSNSDAPLLLTNEIIYEPSASTLLLLTKDTRAANANQKNLLVFADPVFSNNDPRISHEPQIAEQPIPPPFPNALNNFRFAESFNSLQRLPASKHEADSIIGIVGDESKLVTGFAASRELVLNPEISRYKIIHFATHGFLDENRPELSSLVFSRFDERGNNLDGILRLHDIYSLNLAADLVVLSACNTGNGKEIKGEGLISLDNAFLQVGAKSIVSSLWKVEDSVTQEIMKNFYQELAAGDVTTAEALRRAQIKMRESAQYKSPFYWAAFVVKGNFQSSPHISKNVGNSVYLLLALSFLLLPVAYFCYRNRRLLHRKIIKRN